MIWPFRIRPRKKDRATEISEVTRQVSGERTKLYSNLIALDKVTNELDAMVQRSLKLLETKK